MWSSPLPPAEAIAGRFAALLSKAWPMPEAAAALATLETRATGGWDDAVTLLPTDDARTELDDGSGCLMALSHYWQSCRERTANETQVRMANTAVSDLDKHLTGSRVRDRDIFEGDRPICGVETFSKHGFCHR